ncbi:MAG: PRC-barrel domain-containing protein [Rhizobiaceae bacterium]|nr:PRC-barrel domain-containing protein [Rhizobiaceae bacterium]
MIRKLLATTALVSVVATGAYAQEATTPAQPAPAVQEAAPAPAIQPADGFLASNLIGETVYNGAADDAENIGKVNDLVLDSNGSVETVVVGVGGFLGLGEKNVALNFSDLKWAEKNGDRWIVVSATKDQLQSLPDFDRRPYDVVTPVASDTTAVQPAETTAMAPAPADGTATPTDGTATTAQDTTAVPAAPDATTTAAIDRSTLTELPVAEIRSEDLVGTTVYGAEDANVGEIGDVVLNTDGKVDAVIIDVGGFLGIGEKEVAVGMDNLSFMQDANGTKYLYTNFTKEQLEAQAAYDKGTYTEQRDPQRMIIPR